MNNDMLIRVTRYYRALNRLRTIGLEKVFAHNLADAAGVSAAVVRKDFSQLEIHGQKRGGYEITDLISRIGTILVYSDPSQPIPVYPMSRLEEVVGALKVDVAIITVPESAATDTYAQLLEAGVTGIMNFSPVTLKPVRTADGIMPVVHNINIGLELEQIFYELKFPRS